MAFKLQYLDKVPTENNSFAEYGTLCHEILEQWAKDQIPEIALAEEFESRYDDAIVHYFPPFPKGMGQKYFDAGKTYFENFNGFGDEWTILTVEEKFELDIGGYRFVGIADLTLKNKKTGEIMVIDHKSKSMSSMKKELNVYRKQLYIYAAFVKQKFGVFPSMLRFNMFRDNIFIDEKFDEDEYNKTLDWVVETIHSIEKETEWKVSPSSYFCRFVCSTFDHCPAKEAVLNPPPKRKK